MYRICFFLVIVQFFIQGIAPVRGSNPENSLLINKSLYRATGRDDSLFAVPKGVTLETIIERYLKTIGGRRRIRKISHINILMMSKMEGDMILQIERYKKYPIRYLKIIRSENIEFERVIFDGETAIKYNRLGNDTIKNGRLKELIAEASICPEMDYADLGFEMQLLGATKLNGKTPAYVVMLKTPTGNVFYDYYNANSGYKIKRVENITNDSGEKEIITTEYANWEAVNKVKFPRVINIDFGKSKHKMTVTYDTSKRLNNEFFNLPE